MEIDDPMTSLNDGPPDITTITALLSGNMPQPREASVDMSADLPRGVPRWRLPKVLLAGENVRHLDALELPGHVLADGEADRLLSSPLARRATITINGN